MNDELSGKAILKINGKFLVAAFGFGMGWLFWQMAVPGFEAFRIYAAIFYLGGTIAFFKALYQLGQQIWKMRKMARFKRKGKNPKADAMAQSQDFKPTFPKWDAFSFILSLRCVRIKPLMHGLPWFGHLMRDLSAISGLEGRFGPAFGLVDTHLVGPVKPRSFGFG